MSLRLAVFASGGGSNLQALLDRFNKSRSAAARVVLVLSDHEGAGALARARSAGVDAAFISHAGRPADYVAHEIMSALESADVDFVALAGYLRLIPAAIVRRYRQRMLNVHPALLPAFGGKGMYGLRVHEAVLQSACAISGATIHYVDERYDEGRIIAQWPAPVLAGDDAASLAARVLQVEHVLYPVAVELVARALERGDEQPVVARISRSAFVAAVANAPDEAQLRFAFGLD